VDLSGLVDADLPPLTFAYQAGGKEVVNNGHTIQVDYAPGSTLTLNGHDYTLKQFHFHAPSENHIGGQSFPMEAHLVHADAEGNLAVVAVMFELGEANPSLSAVWDTMPERADKMHALKSPVAAYDLLPPRREYFRFSGSLTTPPCSEGVLWLVMKEPVTVSEDQVSRFGFAIGGHPNNRPVQPLNARVVLE
jgi:carbonic anhydrase